MSSATLRILVPSPTLHPKSVLLLSHHKPGSPSLSPGVPGTEVTSRGKQISTYKITKDTKGKTRTRDNHKGLFYKSLFVFFVVKIIFGCPLHTGGAPIFEDLGQLENGVQPEIQNNESWEIIPLEDCCGY